MTGYARLEGTRETGDGAQQWLWAWEIKSVNGKGLDVRFRLPNGFDGLEIPGRKLIGNALARGSVTVNLTLARQASGRQIAINTELLDRILRLQSDLEGEGKVYPSPPRLDVLLGVRGVIDADEEQAISAEDRAAFSEAMLAELERALTALTAMRREEGKRLAEILQGHLDTLASLAERARQTADMQPEAQRERLRAQLALLLEASPPVAEDRLAQELALLATKSDVREELDRLIAHVDACRDLVRNGGVGGRKLDFLCQELNRESNTLCSKATSLELTNIGLELKSTVEQFREQVQNVE